VSERRARSAPHEVQISRFPFNVQRNMIGHHDELEGPQCRMSKKIRKKRDEEHGVCVPKHVVMCLAEHIAKVSRIFQKI